MLRSPARKTTTIVKTSHPRSLAFAIAVPAALWCALANFPAAARQGAPKPGAGVRAAASNSRAHPVANPIATGPQSVVYLMHLSQAALNKRLGTPYAFIPDTFVKTDGIASYHVRGNVYDVVIDDGRVTCIDVEYATPRSSPEEALAAAGINMHKRKPTNIVMHEDDSKYILVWQGKVGFEGIRYVDVARVKGAWKGITISDYEDTLS